MQDESVVDLGRAASFRLGALQVDPPSRRVSSGETLEPRVMQVLVALARANGEVVSRDALIASCWDGRIVGDDSITRVIGALRRLAETRGDGAFRIETVPKVGYRLVGTVAPVAAAAAAPAPIAASSRSRRRWIAGGVGLAAAAAIAFAGLRGFRPHTATPTLVIDPIAADAGLPPHFADDLRETIAANVAPAEFTVRRGDGSASRAVYRLTIRATPVGAGVAAHVQLRVPGNDEPVWTARLDRPAVTTAIAGLASDLQGLSVCVANAHGPRPSEQLTAGQLPLWVAFCADSGPEPSSARDKLEAVVAAVPHFAPAKLELAGLIGDDDITNAAERRRAEPLARSVLADDPGNPSAWEALALLRSPLDFAGREALFLKALSVRPSKCGCVHQTYSYLLSMVGRGADAEREIRRTVDLVPQSSPGHGRLAETMSVNGNFGAADTMLVDQLVKYPDHKYFKTLRLVNALSAQDWPTAATVLASMPDSPAVRIERAMVDAAAKGDRGALTAATAQLRDLLADPAKVGRVGVIMLAVGGDDDSALTAAGRAIDIHPYSITVLFEPALARARQRPAFAALVTRLGLVDYWRRSGHHPDFCREAGAPPLCARIGAPDRTPV